MIVPSGLPDLPEGQEQQLELNLGHLSFHILIRQAHVDAGRVDVPVPQLLLQHIQATAAVGKNDGVAVTEEVGMHCPMQIGPVGARGSVFPRSRS